MEGIGRAITTRRVVAENSPVADVYDIRAKRGTAAAASHGIPHVDLASPHVDEQGSAVATVQEPPVPVVLKRHREARGWDTVWRVADGDEAVGKPEVGVVEEAKQG